MIYIVQLLTSSFPSSHLAVTSLSESFGTSSLSHFILVETFTLFFTDGTRPTSIFRVTSALMGFWGSLWQAFLWTILFNFFSNWFHCSHPSLSSVWICSNLNSFQPSLQFQIRSDHHILLGYINCETVLHPPLQHPQNVSDLRDKLDITSIKCGVQGRQLHWHGRVTYGWGQLWEEVPHPNCERNLWKGYIWEDIRWGSAAWPPNIVGPHRGDDRWLKPLEIWCNSEDTTSKLKS